MSSLEEVYEMVQFARKCVYGDDNIDDYTVLEHITKILQYLHIDVWLITRSNILLPLDKNDEQNENFVVFCFEGTSVLYIDRVSKVITYFSPQNNNKGNVVPKLFERFVNRTYPEYTIQGVVLRSQLAIGDIQNWAISVWFITTLSRYKNGGVDTCEDVQQVLDQECEDTAFIANFYDMCWELVSASRMKHIHNKYAMNKANIYALLDILHKVVKCYCKTIIDDEKTRKAAYSFDVVLENRMVMSKALSYDKLLKCWDRLNKWSSCHNGDVTYMKNTNIELSNTAITHYKYLIECMKNENIVDVYKNNVNLIKDIRESVDDLIMRTLV